MRPNNPEDSLFGAAVLKLSMAKKGLINEAGFRVVYAGTLKELQISDAEVDAYIAENRDRLLARIAASSSKG